MRRLAETLIVAGIILLCVDFIVMATVVVDDTPPVISVTFPENGEVYNEVKLLQAIVTDYESNVVSVKWAGQSGLGGSLVHISASLWGATAPPEYAHGTHGLTFEATNEVGLSTSKTVTFSVQTTGIVGTFYINDQEASSVDSKLTFQTLTLDFKYVKLTGNTASSTFKVEWSGVSSGSSNMASQGFDAENHEYWTSQHGFVEGGTYNVNLVHTDSSGSTILSTVMVALPSSEAIIQHTFGWTAILGFGLIIVGVVLKVAKRRKPS